MGDEIFRSATGKRVGSRRESPVFREGPYRFLFFSREESRIHIHVASGDGEAKFWLSPKLELAENHGLPEREITKLSRIVQDHERQITAAWTRFFGS